MAYFQALHHRVLAVHVLQDIRMDQQMIHTGIEYRFLVFRTSFHLYLGKILVPHRASRRTDLVEIEAGLLRIHVQAGVLDAHVRDTHLHLDSLTLVRIIIEPYADVVSAHLTGITGI